MIGRIAFLFLVLSLSLEAAEAPAAFYLSWQQDPLTTMTVRWLTPKSEKGGSLYFRKKGEKEWKEATASHLPMPGKMAYLIHNVELTELTAGTHYDFHFNDGNIYHFKTLPQDLSTPVNFVVGGDLYHDSLQPLVETHRQAAKTNPDFAIIGGDIAYSASSWWFFSEDGTRWLDFLKAWKEEMITQDGRVIPLIAAIGNHDVAGRYNQPESQAEFFYALFPMPGPQGYNALDFGNYMSIFLLDSNHTHPVDGKQKMWLTYALDSRRSIPYTFAAYHIPAFPSVRKIKPRNQEIQNHWVPLFEQYGLTAAFEHHDHAYKRTLPLYQGKEDREKGVLYLGDGAWGVETPRCPHDPSYWYIAKSCQARHFILVTLDQSGPTFTAIDSKGKIIDRHPAQ